MSNRKNAEQEIELKLHNYKLAIARLREQGRDLSNEARAAIVKDLNKLEEMEKLAEARLIELRDASEESWERIRTEVDSYWDSLGRELKAYDPKH
jgi:hypothetical protein